MLVTTVVITHKHCIQMTTNTTDDYIIEIVKSVHKGKMENDSNVWSIDIGKNEMQ